MTYWWIFVFVCYFWVYTRLAILAIVCPVLCTNCYKQNKKKKTKKKQRKKQKTISHGNKGLRINIHNWTVRKEPGMPSDPPASPSNKVLIWE